MKKILIIIVLLSIFVPVFSDTNNKVAIVYSGKTAVNRETTKYLIKQSSKAGLDYQFEVIGINDAESVTDFKSVIILNTGVKDNRIDPVFKSFIDQTTNKTNLILLTFISGLKTLEVELLTGDNAIDGVDGIASASIYKGAQNKDYEWFDMLIELLDSPIKE